MGLGRFAFQTVLLAPSAKVTIRGLHASIHVKSMPTGVPFDVVTATEIRMGDETLRSWFPVDPTVTGTADVDDDRWQMGKVELEGHHTADKKEAAPHVTVDRRLRVTVPIDPTAR